MFTFSRRTLKNCIDRETVWRLNRKASLESVIKLYKAIFLKNELTTTTYIKSTSKTMSRHETKNVENNDADKELKKRLVLETIQSHCTKDSEFQDFRTIANSLEDGDNLDIKIISGGLTNFSYKIFLHSDESKAPLFAKVTFPRAFWNPDPSVHYDLERTENEFLS